MHSKLGGSFPVPEKFLQKNAAELAKETEKAEKTVGSKSEPERKMGNKAAATTEQAMAKHVVKHIVSEGDLDEVRELTPALTLE